VTAGRPWWASDGPVDGGLDTSEDPVERFRSARRGPAPGADPSAEGSDGRAAGDDPGDLRFTNEPDPHAQEAGGPGPDRPGGEHHVGGRGHDLPPAGPWWEAAAETVSRLARDLADTAEAHEAGTTEPAPGAEGDGPPHEPGHHPGHGPDRDPGRGDDPDDGTAQDAATGPGTASRGAREESHRIDACGVCPICVGLRALGESRPELVGHLAEAARHVALAARSLADRPARTSRDEEPMQHIDLDE
jgi:hypothetical protein